MLAGEFCDHRKGFGAEVELIGEVGLLSSDSTCGYPNKQDKPPWLSTIKG
jgi:hypothetical protein